MAIDQIVEGNGLPVNEQGEILATFAAGTRLRFVVWCSANVSLITTSVATGYTVPAARLLVTGVKTI